MDVNALVDNVIAAIADDEEIKEWCQTKYGRDHTVFFGMDLRDPDLPLDTQLPFVHIAPTAKAVGTDEEEITHSFNVFVEISNESADTPEDQPNVVRYEGYSDLEEFRKLVEMAITSMSDEDRGGRIGSIDIAYGDLLFYPHFSAGMEITTKTPNEMAEDYFE